MKEETKLTYHDFFTHGDWVLIGLMMVGMFLFFVLSVQHLYMKFIYNRRKSYKLKWALFWVINIIPCTMFYFSLSWPWGSPNTPWAVAKHDESLKYIYFFGLICLSIVPSIKIWKEKEDREMFEVLKPIFSTYTLLATMMLFLNNYFSYLEPIHNSFNNNIKELISTLPFFVYPYSLAFMVGEYYVKKEQHKENLS